jgi:plastocyanin
MEAGAIERVWRGRGLAAKGRRDAKGASAAAFAAALALALGLTAPACASAKTWAIHIADMRFEPASLTVARGDTVVWINEDVVAHTATSSPAGHFDSQSIAPGAQWRYRAQAPGRYPYACSFHPTMRATLIVKGAP